jgi:integrase
MGFAEKRGSGSGTYYRGRYKIAPGKYGTLDQKFRTKREAKQAADAREATAAIREQDLEPGEDVTFGMFASRWYAGLDLAPSTMVNYRRHLEEHLLPAFEHVLLNGKDMTRTGIDGWEAAERAAGYARSSVKTWRGTLHAVLAAAVDAHLLPSNPAAKRRGTGKRAGRSAERGPERVVTDPLGALLIAERSAVLSGRDDEFVATTVLFYTGMRWAELVGLETRYARLSSIRIEQQLYELNPGGLVLCPPKDDSYRDVDLPAWLSGLVSDHITRTVPQPCACHGRSYVFRGRYGGAHWRRSGFGDWIFEPAASGWFPAKAPQPRRPVPVASGPFPGLPVRGRNCQGRAQACWLPVATGLTPHGMRHSHKSLMAELRTPEVLSHERLGHELGGVAGRYSHVTAPMREELMSQLTQRWEQALAGRAAISLRSPVAVLDALLQARASGKNARKFSRDSPSGHSGEVIPLRSRPRKGA